MNLIEKFTGRTTYDSYEEFKQNYKVTYNDDFNFAVDVVDAWAQSEPDRMALVWCDDHEHHRDFTFAQISELSKKAASFLYSQGIRKGDRVLLQMKRCWQYWITAVALHRLGAILIPAAFQMAAKDMIYRANAAKARMIICINDPWIVQQIELARPSFTTVDKIALAGEKREGWLDYDEGVANAPADYIKEETLTAKDYMLAYFTSGTTGMPKLVMHNHTYPLGHIVTAGYWQDVQDKGLHFTGADSGWAKFGWGSIYGQWICGSAVLGYDADNKFDPKKMIAMIRKYRPTTFCVPGTIYRFLMKEGLTREDFSSVKHCGTAGEPLAPEITERFRELTGLTIHEGYGQSESSVLVANFPWFPAKAGSMGKPSPLYDIALINENGEECDVGDEGELVVRNLDKHIPEGLMRGYWVEDHVESAYDENNVYHTGDMAWKDEDGYYWFVGRNDDIIKCSGYRIGPFEIESVLIAHPAVHECAIVAAPDPIRGQVVKAVIVLSEDVEASDQLTKELQDYVKKMTAPYKYPRIVEYVSELPKTTSGKIIRHKIRGDH